MLQKELLPPPELHSPMADRYVLYMIPPWIFLPVLIRAHYSYRRGFCFCSGFSIPRSFLTLSRVPLPDQITPANRVRNDPPSTPAETAEIFSPPGCRIQRNKGEMDCPAQHANVSHQYVLASRNVFLITLHFPAIALRQKLNDFIVA